MDTDAPIEVQEGLVTAEDAEHFYALRDKAASTGDINDALELAAYARDLCSDNPMLFGLYFMGRDPAPHIWRLWLEHRRRLKLLLRVSRGHSKTESWTLPTLVQFVCYSIVQGHPFMHQSMYAGFESKPKAAEIMGQVQKILESGGHGGLINLAFRVAWKGESLSIKDYVKARDGDWTKATIDCIRPDGYTRKEPLLRVFAPGEKGIIGTHASRYVFDDFVGRDGARTPHMRSMIRSYWAQVLTGMVGKPNVPVLYVHTLYHDEDQSQILAKNPMYRLVEVPCANRYPTRKDYRLVEGKDGEIRIKLTPHAKDLKPLWPCPVGTEEDCPATEAHYHEVGWHYPTKALISVWLEDPIGYAQQMMHDPRAGDMASVKPYMMRFYTWNPNDPRIGTVATYHDDWDDFVNEANRAGVPIDSEPPRIVAFPFTKTDHSDLAWHGQAWDLSYGKNTESTDETVACTRYRHRDGRVFHRFEAGRWRHGTTMKKVCLATTTDPVAPVREVGLPGGGTESKVSEAVDETRRRLKLDHQFQVKSFTRHRSKDEVFHQSGYAAELANGLGYFDLDDDVTIRQFLSVTPDETGGHDDRWDAAIYAKQLDPLTTGGGFFMVSLD